MNKRGMGEEEKKEEGRERRKWEKVEYNLYALVVFYFYLSGSEPLGRDPNPIIGVT